MLLAAESFAINVDADFHLVEVCIVRIVHDDGICAFIKVSDRLCNAYLTVFESYVLKLIIVTVNITGEEIRADAVATVHVLDVVEDLRGLTRDLEREFIAFLFFYRKLVVDRRITLGQGADSLRVVLDVFRFRYCRHRRNNERKCQ